MTFSAFISHAFSAVPEYVRVLELLENEGVAFVNRSVPAWDPLDAQGTALLQQLEHRIARSDRVIVLATSNLHHRPIVEFEIQAARAHGKQIVGVYPNGQSGAPIPRSLDDGLYRMVGWRGTALAKAIRGEYPPDRRVFDIAEEVEQRRAAALVIGGVAGLTLLLAGAEHSTLLALKAKLRAGGVDLRVLDGTPGDTALAHIAPKALIGAVFGALGAAVFGGSRQYLIGGAALGASLGAGVGWRSYLRAEVRRLGPLMQLCLATYQAK